MKKTLLEATQHWVYSFNAIPTKMIARLMNQNPDEWSEVTMPTIGDTVYVYDEDTNGEITAQVEDGYEILLENGTEITATVDDFTLVQNDILPCGISVIVWTRTGLKTARDLRLYPSAASAYSTMKTSATISG